MARGYIKLITVTPLKGLRKILEHPSIVHVD